MDLKGPGGNVFNAMKYSFQQHFVYATDVTRSQVIVGSVHHD